MKKTMIILAVVALGIATFGFAGAASAQDITPYYPGGGNGRGGNGGNGNPAGSGTGTGIPLEQNINLDGVLDDYMAAYIADGLGITVDELKAREAAGETLVTIGLSLGFDQDYILALHTDARTAALAQAVADGLITQTEADWMLSRLDNGQYGVSSGLCLEDCTGTAQNLQTRMNQGHRGGQQ